MAMNAVTSIDLRTHVLSQLSRLTATNKGPVKTFVRCPFHAERTPSCAVFHGPSDSRPGNFYCFGCGAHGPWNKLAEALSLEAFGRQEPKERFATPLFVGHVGFDYEDDDDVLYVKEKQRNKKPLPKNKKWRGISTNLLRRIGAYTAEFYVPPSDNSPDGYWTNRRLYLPVLINGETKGYIKARLKKHPEYPSYVNASGHWSRKVGLFPFDYTMKVMRKANSKTVVLVEGQRDALRLLAMGIPALCILGTQSWSETKAITLETAGVERIILLMDGDCAGIAATKKIKPTITKMFDVKALKLWKMKGSPWLKFQDEDEPSKAAKKAGVTLWDPGNVPEKILLAIKRKYFEE